MPPLNLTSSQSTEHALENRECPTQTHGAENPPAYDGPQSTQDPLRPPSRAGSDRTVVNPPTLPTRIPQGSDPTPVADPNSSHSDGCVERNMDTLWRLLIAVSFATMWFTVGGGWAVIVWGVLVIVLFTILLLVAIHKVDSLKEHISILEEKIAEIGGERSENGNPSVPAQQTTGAPEVALDMTNSHGIEMNLLHPTDQASLQTAAEPLPSTESAHVHVLERGTESLPETVHEPEATPTVLTA